MIRNSLLATAVLTATAIGSATFADPDHGYAGKPGSDYHPGMMMQFGGPGMTGDTMGMMQRMHGGMMGGGITGGMGPMGIGLMQMFDADGDTTVTPEEMGAHLQAKLTEYDSDGDGTLSIAEFEILHSAMFREIMVDRFQYLDADGDGAVTAEEMTAPADKMRLMQTMFEMHFGDGQAPSGNTPGMGNGSMMNEN